MTPHPDVLLARTAGEEEAGRRIDQVVAGWLGEARNATVERISAAMVRVAGKPVAKSHRLTAGEAVEVLAPPPEDAPAPPPPVPVRYEDHHLLVVAKPAGLVVHRGSGTRGATLVDALLAMGVTLADVGDPERPGIVHRLDRGTSGLLVVAKTPEAAAGLKAHFAVHDVHREYWALVDGVPNPPSATVDAPLARSRTQRTRFAVDAAGRRAVSHYDVLVDHDRCAEVRVRLETGRTHQVRVHLAAVGHPVAADAAYGASDLGAALGLDRPALHARRLGFAHPVTGAPIDLEEDLPADLEAAVARL